ncbi:dihydroorotase family protein [Amycolatopsis sp. FDAARGOS 1241]|uniref:dihydroorotase n=1 Tax=Amycolatopsis sp. FDAARGOS 1241 TaxID=2778070 RepID=UPI00194E7437|nr:dihydroorotase family protein [Amycolatopsis sp. FDAARGOS 1241]QRP43363.1 dihydroorotase family protein [Amycolatopsis sp. FDAARGOS 1241]
MSIDLRVAGGRVQLPSGAVDGDLLVNEGKVVGVVAGSVEVADVGRTVDATGKLVLPGMVDVHVHTREPGFTHKEDIHTTSLQAAAGGVTTIFGMPNLNPPTTTAQTLREVFDLYAEKSIVDWNHNPAATRPDEIAPMAAMGVNAYKIYMVVDTGRTYPHPAGTGMHGHGDLLRMMDTIAKTGKRFIIHPHDQSLMDYIEGEYLARGENTPQGYASAYAARNGVIWDTAIEVVLRLAEASGCPVHLAHIQTRRSVEAVRRAREHGVDVTCEVNHWLPFLSTWDDVEKLGPYALSYWVPDDGREAVWDGLRDGTIDMFSSDHAPHTREEKEIGWTKMWSSHTGTPGIQYFYPLTLDAVNKGLLTLDRAVELVAGAPAGKFGLSGVKGALTPGCDADFVIADLDAPWTITNEGVLSKIGWTPYDGRQLTAAIEQTYVRGTEVFAHGKVTGEAGHGKQAVSGKVQNA